MSKVKTKHLSWSRPATEVLIDVYEKRPCLYDVKSPDYHNREKARDALEEMVNAVRKYHPDVTTEDCKKKYQGLRQQYCREHSKFLASVKSGAGTDEIELPKLWCYRQLQFLKDSIKSKVGNFYGADIGEYDDSEEQDDLEGDNVIIEFLDNEGDLYENIAEEVAISNPIINNLKRKNVVPSTSSSGLGRKKRISESSASRGTKSSSRSREATPTTSEEVLMSNLTNYLDKKDINKEKPKETSKSKDAAFVNFVASRVCDLKPKHKREAQQKIIELIFRYENMDNNYNSDSE